MVKAAGFIEKMAEVMGLPIETVKVAYRVMRTEGLLTTGARGVNAPEMVPLDAARMLIWGLVSDRPVDAAQVVRDFGAAPFEKTWKRTDNLSPFDPAIFAEAKTFEQAVALFISLLANDADAVADLEDANVEIQSSDMICAIEIDGTGFNYSYPLELGDGSLSIADLRRVTAPYLDRRSVYERNIKQTRSLGLPLLEEIAQMFEPSEEDE